MITVKSLIEDLQNKLKLGLVQENTPVMVYNKDADCNAQIYMSQVQQISEYFDVDDNIIECSDLTIVSLTDL